MTREWHCAWLGPPSSAHLTPTPPHPPHSWQNAAVRQSLGPDYVEYTAVCDGCGHCGDLSGPHAGEDPSITTQHAAIAAYVEKWLA